MNGINNARKDPFETRKGHKCPKDFAWGFQSRKNEKQGRKVRHTMWCLH